MKYSECNVYRDQATRSDIDPGSGGSRVFSELRYENGVSRRDVLRTTAVAAATVALAANHATGDAKAEVAPASSVRYPLSGIPDVSNKVEWSIEPQRAVLLVHDVQLYFTRIFHPTMRNELLTNILRFRRWCDIREIPVTYSAQLGGATRAQRGLMYDFAGMGMSSHPRDNSIDLRVRPRAGETVFVKHKLSEFFQSELLTHMQEMSRDQLIIVGVYCNTGVLLTAADALQNNIQSFVVADAVADQTRRGHQEGLNWIAARVGSVTTLDGLLV